MPDQVIVYDSRLDALFVPGREAARYATRILREIKVVATAEAPARTGSLKRAHGLTGVLKIGPYQARGAVYNDAEHAKWVHDGTAQNGAGWIYPKRGPFLIWRDGRAPITKSDKNPNRMMKMRRVHGQKANPWLDRAARIVLTRNGH